MKNKHLPNNYRIQKLKASYLQLQERFQRALQNGSFYHWSGRKKAQMKKRLARYVRQIQKLGGKELQTALSTGLLAAFLTVGGPSTMKGQSFEVVDFAPSAFGLSDIGNNSSPTFVDIDGDGDLDAFVGETDGNTNFFRNTSTNSSIPAFNLESSDNAFGLSDIGQNSRPTFVDIDGDGDLDAFVGERYGNTNFLEILLLIVPFPLLTWKVAIMPLDFRVLIYILAFRPLWT